MTTSSSAADAAQAVGAPGRAPVLVVTDLHKAFGQTPALRGADLQVSAGEVVAVLGPSGSGKSTLLHCAAGIQRPDAGSVLFRGADLASLDDRELSALRRREFGFVFQFGQLLPELTCLDNVAVPLRLRGVGRRAATAAAREWLGRLDVAGIADQYPGQVSGGQAQRAAVARALIGAPSVIFADEPTGALDTFHGEKVMDLLVGAVEDIDAALILVTHEPRVAAYSDREVVVRTAAPPPVVPHDLDGSGPVVAVPDRAHTRLLASVSGTAAWALSMATADKRNRTRLVVMAVGIGLCAFALLAVATVDPLVRSVMARADASQPSTTAAGSAFRYQDVSNVVDGEVVKGTLLSGPLDAAPPPGTEVFPGPRELLVSPALATALADPGGQSLRALVPGSVVGVIAPSTLTSAQEWRYYQGVDDLPADAFTATGWGVDTQSFYEDEGGFSVASMNPQVWVILITGVTVLMIPLLLFTAMAGRIGAAHRDRRSATLRLLGASSAQLRWIVAAEVAMASVAGLLLAAAGYLTVRVLAPLISVGEYGAQTADVHPDPIAAALIAVGVPVLAGASALLGTRRASINPLGDHTRATRRPTLWWRLMLLVVTVGVTAYVLERSAQWGGDSFGYGTYGLCLIVVLDIACAVVMVAPLAHWVAVVTTTGGPGVQLARGRIIRHPGSSSRPAAAVASVLASVIALMSVLQLQPNDPFAAGDAPRPYFGRVVDLSPGDWQRLYHDLRAVNGVTAVEMSAALPISATQASAQLLSCDAIRWMTDTGTVCTDGDVFGQMESAASPDQDRFSVTGSASIWSPPSDTRVTRTTAPDGQPVQNSYLLTPAVVQTQIPDLSTIADTRIGVWVSPSALGAARDAVSWLGWQGATVLTYSDYASDVESFSWVRVTLLVCAVFVLLLSALAQWLLAAEYVNDRRRSFALARASGVPVSTLSLSVVIGALIPVIVGVVIAVGVGSLLAWEIADTRGADSFSVDLTWLGISCGTTLLVSSAVALGTAAQLRRTTGPAALRTE